MSKKAGQSARPFPVVASPKSCVCVCPDRGTLAVMRVLVAVGLLIAGFPLPLVAQTDCSKARLAHAESEVATLRQQLHTQAVRMDDPLIPNSVKIRMMQLKSALEEVATTILDCASGSATPDQLQKELADALQISPSASAVSDAETDGKRDIGAYGADLSVRVLELFGTPHIIEVDFRYGIECGDDHVLLVFSRATEEATGSWQEQIRWDAPRYSSISDAFGDFVLLTPLPGSAQYPQWRYLVAHGRPSCGDVPRPSEFDLDLLTPTADAKKPKVDWHFEHGYMQNGGTPRLVTTEDTVDFSVVPRQGGEKDGIAVPLAASPETFRFHLTSEGRLEPVQTNAAETSPGGKTDATGH